ASRGRPPARPRALSEPAPRGGIGSTIWVNFTEPHTTFTKPKTDGQSTMGMRQYRRYRDTRTATSTMLMLALLSLGMYSSARAQDSTGPELQPTGEVRQATVGTPRVLTLKNLAQARLQVRTAQPVGAQQGASL